MRNNYLLTAIPSDFSEGIADLLSLVFTIICTVSFAQNPLFPELAPNLIPNPGFEKFSSRTGRYNRFHH